MDNVAIARILREVADLLEIKSDNPFRIRAYRSAADSVSNHSHEMATLDANALREIPGIGKNLAARIREIADTAARPEHTVVRRVQGLDPPQPHTLEGKGRGQA